jgi:hypothetical protein
MKVQHKMDKMKGRKTFESAVNDDKHNRGIKIGKEPICKKRSSHLL